jgi:probable rRNA maturation factor
LPAEISRESSVPPLPPEEEAALRAAVEEALRSEGVPDAEVAVHLGDDALLQALNRRFRGADRPTDVLSFCLEDGDGPPLPPGVRAPLGDVVISVERARQQAAAFGHSLRRELCYLAVHGTLHLLGYDDADPAGEAEMARRAEAVLGRLGIGR